MPMIIFSLDILIVSNTSYYSKGLLITKKSKIFKNYLRNHAFMHLISILFLFYILNYFFLRPTFITMIDNSFKEIEILFLLRAIYMEKLLKRFNSTLDLAD